VKNVYEAWSTVAKLFSTENSLVASIDSLSSVDVSASINDNVSIGRFSIVGPHSVIGTGTEIMAQVYIGSYVRIGKNVKIYPGVRILNETVIGDNVIIHSNTVIGSDGFGFSFSQGKYSKIAQTGNVIIEDDVELGANVCVDRAAIGSTIIRKGSKLDNLIQVAHNVEIGEHVAIAAQAGIAGSSKIGNWVQLGGQSAISGHISIAAGSQIQGQSGVTGDIKIPNKKWYGYPVLNYWNYLRSYAIFKSLPELKAKIDQLEKRIKEFGSE
jgi:UDP-3-O-[3-hydroxymyristoyl] glucosamine N-acyltransferase